MPGTSADSFLKVFC